MTRSTTTSKLEELVRQALPSDRSAVVAVSGGMDSMVLLDLAVRASRGGGCAVTAATFDHASGPHSARAAFFVAGRALAYGVPIVIGREASVGSTEAAWRAARWSFLRSIARATNAVIVTAHTRDDQIETVLMRALRGAGARGLAGLVPSNDVRRPLVDISRSELRAYASARALAWVEDPTNRSPRYLRNRVRHDLLPALRRVRPAIGDDLLELARRAAEWRRELASLVDRGIRYTVAQSGGAPATLDVVAADLASYTRPELAILWPELASRVGLALDARGTRRTAEFTISSHSGARIQLSGGWELMRSRTSFELRPSEGERTLLPRAQPLEPPTTWDRWTFHAVRGSGATDAWSASLETGQGIYIRAWRPGDRLTIRHDGRLIARKVKYFLSDAGISGHIRPRWPVVIAGGEVVWIPGVRRSDAATARSGGPVVTYVCDYLDRRS